MRTVAPSVTAGEQLSSCWPVACAAHRIRFGAGGNGNWVSRPGAVGGPSRPTIWVIGDRYKRRSQGQSGVALWICKPGQVSTAEGTFEVTDTKVPRFRGRR
jgi:hypothetical protein